MSEYFGKGCEFFTGQWEDEHLYEDESYKEYEPVLVHCAHVNNYQMCEGNCNKEDCPLGKKE
jgi:hypothetical protein